MSSLIAFLVGALLALPTFSYGGLLTKRRFVAAQHLKSNDPDIDRNVVSSSRKPLYYEMINNNKAISA